MKTVVIIFLLMFSGIQAQNKTSVFDNFKDKFSLIEDKFIFNLKVDENVKTYEELSYNNLNVLLKIENESWIEIVNVDLVDFYAIGLIKLEESHTGFIIYQKSKDYDLIDRELFLAIFSKENIFIGLVGIGELLYWAVDLNFTSIVYPNGTIIKQSVNKNNSTDHIYQQFHFEKIDNEIVWYFEDLDEVAAMKIIKNDCKY